VENRVINWERAGELREEIGPADFAEVVDLFLEEVSAVMGLLHEIEDEQLGANLHFIKGSALNLGFRALADACLAGERLVAAGRPEMVDLDGLDSVYQQSLEEFQHSQELRLAG
jgi:HPt (histidine-containing phosphotransfer) domain-containing protein